MTEGNCGLHESSFNFDDNAIEKMSEMWLELAKTCLNF